MCVFFFFFNARVLVYGFVYNYVLHGEFLRRAPFFFFCQRFVLTPDTSFFFFTHTRRKKKGFWSSKTKKKDNAVKRALNRKLTLRWNARGIRCEWAEFHVITIMVNSRDQRFSFLLLKRTSFFSLFSRLCQRIYKRRFARKNQTAKEKKKKECTSVQEIGREKGFFEVSMSVKNPVLWEKQVRCYYSHVFRWVSLFSIFLSDVLCVEGRI